VVKVGAKGLDALELGVGEGVVIGGGVIQG
jgi:hypothetical protein